MEPIWPASDELTDFQIGNNRTVRETMSTKRTLRSGPKFRLYREGFDDESIYLELDHCEFCANERSVSVKIPVPIWEYIREVSPTDLSLAKLSDRDLRNLVERQLKEHARLTKEDSFLAKLTFSMWGEGTVAQKFRNAMTWYKKKRARQRKIVAEIEALRDSATSAIALNRPSCVRGPSADKTAKGNRITRVRKSI